MTMLRELFHGNIGFDSRIYQKGSPFSEAVKRREEAREKLKELLNDEGKELFEQYDEAASDVHSITTYDLYEYTLRFAISLMAELFMCGGCTGRPCDDDQDESDT